MPGTIPEPLLRHLYAYDHDLPLEPVTSVVEDGAELLIERFAINSVNDERVPGLILRDPRRSGPQPAIFVAHPATLDKSSDYILRPARDWVRRGVACVTIDQAGHGERARRPQSMEDFTRYPLRRAASARQTAVDWMHTLDYLSGRDEVNAERIGFAGFSMGGMRGAAFVGLDVRVRAAAFCISGAAGEPPPGEQERLAQTSTDPATFAPFMHRATPIVAGEKDDIVPPDRARRFFEAMPEPREIAWGPYGHWDFMPAGLAPLWPFFERHLLD